MLFKNDCLLCLHSISIVLWLCSPYWGLNSSPLLFFASSTVVYVEDFWRLYVIFPSLLLSSHKFFTVHFSILATCPDYCKDCSLAYCDSGIIYILSLSFSTIIVVLLIYDIFVAQWYLVTYNRFYQVM